jgi:hypothetical protein
MPDGILTSVIGLDHGSDRTPKNPDARCCGIPVLRARPFRSLAIWSVSWNP